MISTNEFFALKHKSDKCHLYVEVLWATKATIHCRLVIFSPIQVELT